MTLISVIIPAFDRLASLHSVLQCYRGADNIELVVVDDKSPHSAEIQEISKKNGALYVRNESRASEREPALCRNLGLDASSGDIIVFNDADVLVPDNAVELHRTYHMRNRSVVVSAQVWSIPDGEGAVNAIKEFTLEGLKSVARPFVQDGSIRWSTVDDPVQSDNWWAFLSANCSFKRAELVRIGRWDQEYRGWGVEDNDIAYRAFTHGLHIFYSCDLVSFHIDHTMSREHYREKCRSAFRNLKLMCEKYPSIAGEERVRRRLLELEALSKGDLSHVVRQATAGGGLVKG
jgi:glycosyltransferase involved in cell wall biosynthesis